MYLAKLTREVSMKEIDSEFIVFVVCCLFVPGVHTCISVSGRLIIGSKENVLIRICATVQDTYISTGHQTGFID